MRTFGVAGVQMRVVYGHDNIPAMRSKLEVLLLRFPWVEMVLFSELCAFGPSLAHAQELPGPAEAAFCEMARAHGVWLLPGTLFERAGGRIYNTASVIAPDGAVVGRYRKLFPFRPYETQVDAGEDFLVFDVPEVGRFGVSICYDMWFPETTRTLAALGAEVLLHPSLTNTIDRDVELSIARTSAAVNQCYVLDVNGVGHGGYGRSILVRPSGNVIYEAGAGEELMPVTLDLEAVDHNRRNGLFGLGQPLKSFRDRRVRFGVYDAQGPHAGYLEGLGPLAVPTRDQMRRRPAGGAP